ncbi:MAG: rhodanese-like domain-containing protein [Cyclobacteriaceae bacterium]|jgi:phage shock protein E|nr:rhodanese-like domain-containing protein [Cyclobacteriaceae bacterium]
MKQKAIIILFLLTTYACSQAQSLKVVDVATFEKLTKDKNVFLLDVRTPNEYKNGHLKGATLIDFYQSDFKQKLAKLDKQKTILVYCKSGGRSNNTGTILKEMGFKDVYDLQGGITAWEKAGKPIEK